MTIPERLGALRAIMQEKGIDFYIVPTDDFHQSEYVGEYFKARAYITGFTGSAGTAVITKDSAMLWTDGRYFIQAAGQLEGSTVDLMKMGEPGVPTIMEYLEEHLDEGMTLGFDGRVVAMGDGIAYRSLAEKKHAKIESGADLIDEVWKDRPPLSEEPAFALELKYAGESTADKLARIREAMKKSGATVHILSTLDDICWILNIRGNDVEYFPLVLSYAIITMDQMHLYINEAKLSAELKKSFAADGIVLHPYNAIYEDVKGIGADEAVMIDPRNINYAIYSNLPEGIRKVEEQNPEILMKCIKNPVEVENIRTAQIKDSVAHIRFMKWLKEHIGKEKITEISASDKLDEFRVQMGNYIRPSFGPISSYAGHAAMCHYAPTPESDVELKEGALFLTDTGAGFWEGSTDITRTYALGEIPEKIKEDFTLVAISNLSIADARFLYKSTGVTLDILARKPFWDRNLNFNHGTGHGVGYLLNIHEGPAALRWVSRVGEDARFEENMIVTDEPGIYIEGSHGVRLENELLVRKGVKNEYGQFMYFEIITYVPFDLDALKPEMMTSHEKDLLNRYHKKVYEMTSPYLNEEEKEWLAHYTREV